MMEGCGCDTCVCGAYDFGENQNWIQIGEFPLHSGNISQLKFELTKFTESDWESISFLIAKRFKFQYVVGIPTGGMRLAQAMAKYNTNDPDDPIALVDDVFTTGNSMRQAHAEIFETLPIHKTLDALTPIIGIIAIARGQLTKEDSKWIYPFLQLGDGWDI